MKSFQFSLESVLHLRRREEDAAKQSYAEAVGFRTRCQVALEQAMQDLEALQEQLMEKRSGLTHRDDHLMFLHAIRLQREFCQTVTQRLERAEQLVRVRLDVWMESRKKVEMLVRLKDKQIARHRAEMQRQEEKAVEDLITARYVRAANPLTSKALEV